MKPTLVILAAGAGARYGGPKQLAPIGPSGETLLEYSAFDALRTGFGRVVLVVRQESESAFRGRFDSGLAKHVPVAYLHQTLDDLPADFVRAPDRVKPWGTGHAVLAAEQEIGGPFAIVNADDFYGAESFELLSKFLSRTGSGSKPRFCIVGFPVGETLSDAGPVSRGLCQIDEDGHLQRIIEIPQVWKRGEDGAYTSEDGGEVTVAGDDLASMNMWGFSLELFPELRQLFEEFLSRSGQNADSEFYLPGAIQDLLNEDRVEVEVLRGTGRWCGITYREDEAHTETVISELVALGRYPAKLWD